MRYALAAAMVLGLSGGAWAQVGPDVMTTMTTRPCYGAGECGQSNALRDIKPRYTVDEIDRMRAAIRAQTTVLHPATSGPTYVTLDWSEHAPDAVIEDRLRTYMSQGISPAELEAKVK